MWRPGICAPAAHPAAASGTPQGQETLHPLALCGASRAWHRLTRPSQVGQDERMTGVEGHKLPN